MNKLVKHYSVIIPAAGVGSRMQSSIPKQYLKIGNKTVIEHTLERFINLPQINNIVIAVSPLDQTIHNLKITSLPKVTLVKGGNERVDSVRNALQSLAKSNAHNEFVLVHDAARPCLRIQDLEKLTAVCEDNYSKGISGGILAIPVADTIKQNLLDSNNVNLKASNLSLIQATIDRSSLWQAQTPQMFKHLDLLAAIEQSLNKGYQITDEASAMEHMGHKVALIEGDISNIKITRPNDLKLASFYLS